jgi:hypothetical protein
MVMDFNSVMRLISESPYTKALSFFRIWCDEHSDRTKYNVNSKSALFEYGREHKIPKNVIHEIADDMEIAVNMDEY